jgi:hypothetical protein
VLTLSQVYGTPGLPSKSNCSYGWRSGSDIGWLIDDSGMDWRQTTCASSVTKNRKLSTTSSCCVPSPSKFGGTPAASLARFRGWRPQDQDTILEFWNAWRSQWIGPAGAARTRSSLLSPRNSGRREMLDASEAPAPKYHSL